MYWFHLWDFKQVISLFSSIRNIPVILLNWEWRSFAFIFLIPHLFTEVGRRHGRDCEICAFSRVRCWKGAHRTIGRRCPPPLHASVQAQPGEPVLSGGATAGGGRVPLKKVALAAAGSAAAGHNSQVTKCKVLSSHLSPEFFLCLWDQVSSSAILSNYFIFS